MAIIADPDDFFRGDLNSMNDRRPRGRRSNLSELMDRNRDRNRSQGQSNNDIVSLNDVVTRDLDLSNRDVYTTASDDTWNQLFQDFATPEVSDMATTLANERDDLARYLRDQVASMDNSWDPGEILEGRPRKKEFNTLTLANGIVANFKNYDIDRITSNDKFNSHGTVLVRRLLRGIDNHGANRVINTLLKKLSDTNADNLRLSYSNNQYIKINLSKELPTHRMVGTILMSSYGVTRDGNKLSVEDFKTYNAHYLNFEQRNSLQRNFLRKGYDYMNYGSLGRSDILLTQRRILDILEGDNLYRLESISNELDYFIFEVLDINACTDSVVNGHTNKQFIIPTYTVAIKAELFYAPENGLSVLETISPKECELIDYNVIPRRFISKGAKVLGSTRLGDSQVSVDSVFRPSRSLSIAPIIYDSNKDSLYFVSTISNLGAALPTLTIRNLGLAEESELVISRVLNNEFREGTRSIYAITHLYEMSLPDFVRDILKVESNEKIDPMNMGMDSMTLLKHIFMKLPLFRVLAII